MSKMTPVTVKIVTESGEDARGNLSNPLAVGSIGDGESIVVENIDGSVTTKLVPIAGRDNSDKARFIRTNNDGYLDTSQTELFSVFNLMLIELKILNFHLSLMTDNEIKEQDL